MFLSALWDSTGKNSKIWRALRILRQLGISLQPVNQVPRWRWLVQKKVYQKSRGTIPFKWSIFSKMSSYLAGLAEDSEYECLVQARNRFGWSEPSRLFTFFTSKKGEQQGTSDRRLAPGKALALWRRKAAVFGKIKMYCHLYCTYCPCIVHSGQKSHQILIYT